MREWIDRHLFVDDRKEKPFHCDECGNTYEACYHWSPEDKLGE